MFWQYAYIHDTIATVKRVNVSRTLKSLPVSLGSPSLPPDPQATTDLFVTID